MEQWVQKRAEGVGRKETDMHSLPQNLQEALGLPIGVGNKDNLAENPEDKEVWETTEIQGEEEEATTAPSSSPNPFPSPSPTPEDTVTYICEYPEARVACLSSTDPTRRPDTSEGPKVPRSACLSRVQP